MDSRSIRGLWSPDVYFEGFLDDGLIIRATTIRTHVEELGVRLHDFVETCDPACERFGWGAVADSETSLGSDF